MKLIKKTHRMFKLHRIFIKQDLKKLTEYKVDFLTGALGMLLAQAINLFFLSIIFSQIPKLKGYTFEQIIFIYGFALLPKAIDHLFFDNLWSIGYFIVRKGDFDKYLTRPVSTLFAVTVEKFQVDAFGELVVGITFLCVSIPRISVNISFINVLLFIAAVFFATFIYTGIKLITSSIAFWTKRSGHIMYMFYMVNEFSKYPTSIYNKLVASIVTYIIPFAFTAFFPASYFLTGENPLYNIGGTVLMSAALMTLGIFVWNKGVRSYESAGS